MSAVLIVLLWIAVVFAVLIGFALFYLILAVGSYFSKCADLADAQAKTQNSMRDDAKALLRPTK